MIKPFGPPGIFLNEYIMNEPPYSEKTYQLVESTDELADIVKEWQDAYPNSKIKINPRTITIRIYK